MGSLSVCLWKNGGSWLFSGQDLWGPQLTAKEVTEIVLLPVRKERNWNSWYRFPLKSCFQCDRLCVSFDVYSRPNLVFFPELTNSDCYCYVLSSIDELVPSGELCLALQKQSNIFNWSSAHVWQKFYSSVIRFLFLTKYLFSVFCLLYQHSVKGVSQVFIKSWGI